MMRSRRNLLIVGVLGGWALVAFVIGVMTLTAPQKTTVQTVNGFFFIAVGAFSLFALYRWFKKGMPE
jgi:hypothetical protein